MCNRLSSNSFDGTSSKFGAFYVFDERRMSFTSKLSVLQTTVHSL